MLGFTADIWKYKQEHRRERLFKTFLLGSPTQTWVEYHNLFEGITGTRHGLAVVARHRCSTHAGGPAGVGPTQVKVHLRLGLEMQICVEPLDSVLKALNMLLNVTYPHFSLIKKSQVAVMFTATKHLAIFSQLTNSAMNHFSAQSYPDNLLFSKS